MNEDVSKCLRIIPVSFLLILAVASTGYTASFNVGGIRISKNVKTMREIKRKNVVSQSMDYSCGPAGLSTLLNYYLEDSISENEIINTLLKQVPLEKVKERRGFTLLDLKKFARSKGYNVTGYKMDVEFLRKLNKPVLVPIKFKNYRHFVIVKGVMADRIFIADPAVGNMSMKISKFEKVWTNGIGLLVEDASADGSTEYALKVDREDLIVSDYKRMRRLIDRGAIRTAIYPSEWK